MGRKKHRAEEIVAKLRQVDVLVSQGRKVAEAIRSIEVTEVTYRDELLNGEVFYTLKEASVVIERWRKDYNTIRPHSSLGYHPPAPEVVIWPTEPSNSAPLARPTIVTRPDLRSDPGRGRAALVRRGARERRWRLPERRPRPGPLTMADGEGLPARFGLPCRLRDRPCRPVGADCRFLLEFHALVAARRQQAVPPTCRLTSACRYQAHDVEDQRDH